MISAETAKLYFALASLDATPTNAAKPHDTGHSTNQLLNWIAKARRGQ